MSLFAGVNFRVGQEKAKGSDSAAAPIQVGASGRSLHPSSTETPVANASAPAPAPVQWSAALRFAPSAASRKKAGNVGASTAPSSQASLPSSIPSQPNSVAADPAPASLNTSYAASAFPPLPGHTPPIAVPASTQSSFMAASTSASTSSAVAIEYDSTDAQGRKVFKPPAMTLEAGRAPSGFKKRSAEQMTGGNAGGGGGRSKKKGRKNAALFASVETPPFDPHEPYNPSRPTDLAEYKAYRRQYREERRAREKEAEARKRVEMGPDGGRRNTAHSASEGSSYYSEDEAEETRAAVSKGWAPPVGLYGSSANPASSAPAFRRASPPDEEGEEHGYRPNPTTISAPNFPTSSSSSFPHAAQLIASPSVPVAPEVPIPVITGEEAYQRRLKLSQLKSETADEAYARRVALSSGAVQNLPSFSSASGIAYVAPQPPRPPIAPTVSGPDRPASPEPLGDFVDLSAFEDDNAAPTQPPASAMYPGPPAPPLMPDDFAKKLEERKAAAAAIAAKFAAIAPPAPPADEDPEDLVERMAREVERETAENSGTFAEKMMRRWGHEEGKGLGKDGTGIVHAFSAEHVNPSTTITSNNAKKSKANLAAGTSGGQWVQSTSSKGRLVNLNEDEKKKEEKERFGEPSRVVLLRNVVGGVEEADEELSGEIGEECGKNGIVERVVLHVVSPPPEDPSEGLRIFVQFSGLAGAWRTIKEMDGRFFGGRQVRATYFNEGRFTKGDRSGRAL